VLYGEVWTVEIWRVGGDTNFTLKRGWEMGYLRMAAPRTMPALRGRMARGAENQPRYRVRVLSRIAPGQALGAGYYNSGSI